MKIKKSELKNLIESYLFEDEEKGLKNYTGGSSSGKKTKDVKFNWGTYTGDHANEEYMILPGETSLGDVQQNGDPFTYKKMPNGKYKIISGPAKFKSSIGEIINIKKRTRTDGGQEGPEINLDNITPGGFDATILDDLEEALRRRDEAIAQLAYVSGTAKLKTSGRDSEGRYRSEDANITFNEEYIKKVTGQSGEEPPGRIPKSLIGQLKNGKNIEEYNSAMRDIELINLMLFGDFLRSLKEFFSDLLDNDLIKIKNAAALGEKSKDLYREYFKILLQDFCYGHEKNITHFWNKSFRIHAGKSGKAQKNSILAATTYPLFRLIAVLPQSKDEKDLKTRVQKLIKAIANQEANFIF